MSLGNPGHRLVVMRRALDAHPLQHGGHDLHVLGACAPHLDLAARDRGDHRPAAGLDVVAPQPVLGAVQRRAAFDANRRRPPAGDADAELRQKRAELDDVRLARRVADLGDTRRAGRRKQRGLGAGDRRLVEIDGRRPQAVRRFEHVACAFDLTRAHRLERLEMRRKRAARWEIAAGRRQVRTSTPREQRPEQQHGAAQPSDERAVGLVFHDRRAAHAQRRAADAFDLAAEIENQPRHHLDVADPRYVGQDALVLRQQARREQRQRSVFVAFDFDGAR
jgi:hypothetical protein